MNRLFTIIMLGTLVLLDCADLGGSSVSGNGRIVGFVVDEQGSPALNAQVELLPAQYNPLQDPIIRDESIDTTDENGEYQLENIRPGMYTIQVKQRSAGTRALVSGITAGDESVTIPLARLQIPGTVKIYLPDSANLTNSAVYIPGTTLSARVENGVAILDSVPAGTIPALRFVNPTDTTKNRVLKSDFTVSGGTTTAVYSAWAHSKKLVLNTTATGADVATDVFHFPLLVRLRSYNMDFSKAQADGGDVRFTKSDGTMLPFEIERWDSVSGLAAIWVKVDTIYGNNSTQSIIMLYGNPLAKGTSNGAKVFDTANGFVGVWHLNETAGLPAIDATGNGYDGIPSPSSPTDTRRDNRLNKKFDGISQYYTMPNTANSKLDFSENSVYCISAWVWADSPLVASRQAVVSKGDRQYALEIRDSSRWSFSLFKDLAGWEIAASDSKSFHLVKPDSWDLVTGILSAGRVSLYINDGLCTDTTNQFIASTKSRLTGFDLSIGRVEGAASPFYFAGEIDEVRISRVAPGRDWVTLCFRNQKLVDRLITFQ